jgi:RimJ/RimL family protein N-acetyltransferase
MRPPRLRVAAGADPEAHIYRAYGVPMPTSTPEYKELRATVRINPTGEAPEPMSLDAVQTWLREHHRFGGDPGRPAGPAAFHNVSSYLPEGGCNGLYEGGDHHQGGPARLIRIAGQHQAVENVDRDRRSSSLGAAHHVKLETRRLRLRPFSPEDAADHLRLYRDPEVTRMLGGGPFDEETARVRSASALERFRQSWAEHGFGVWALIDRASGRLIGQCGLLHLPESPDIEILYLLERDHWGRGLAAEAAREVLRHAFEDLKLPRIVAVTRPEHMASRRVMEKLGMRQEADRDVFGLHAVCYTISPEAFGRPPHAGGPCPGG